MGHYRIVIDAQTHAVHREEITVEEAFEQALEALKRRRKPRIGRNGASGQNVQIPAITKDEFVAEVHRLIKKYGVDPAVCAALLKQ